MMSLHTAQASTSTTALYRDGAVRCASAFRCRRMSSGVRRLAICVRAASGKDQDPDSKRALDGTPKATHKKGNNFEKADRRRGRPAYLRSPDDTPLRDANRDFILGVLTARACRTLIVYLQETNLNVAQWLVNYMSENPITLSGSWEDISGDTFMRKLLSTPVQEAKYSNGTDQLHDNFSSICVDPRSIAQRILDIRAQLALEVAEDLKLVPDDNSELLRQSLRASLENCLVMEPAVGVSAQLEADHCAGFVDECDSSSGAKSEKASAAETGEAPPN